MLLDIKRSTKVKVASSGGLFYELMPPMATQTQTYFLNALTQRLQNQLLPHKVLKDEAPKSMTSHQIYKEKYILLHIFITIKYNFFK